MIYVGFLYTPAASSLSVFTILLADLPLFSHRINFCTLNISCTDCSTRGMKSLVDEEKLTALGPVSKCSPRRNVSPVFPSSNIEKLREPTDGTAQSKSTGTLCWKSGKKKLQIIRAVLEDRFCRSSEERDLFELVKGQSRDDWPQ